MKSLPEWVTTKLQPNLHIVYWTRRARYEVVEEVSEALFRAGMISWFAWILIENTSLEAANVMAVALICSLYLGHKAILEILRWQNEYHVVCEDPINGGGRVYKFYGFWNRMVIDEKIDDNSPTIIISALGFARLWGWLTGEKMEKVVLKGRNNTYLDGQKVSPRYAAAIKEVRGTPKVKEDLSPTDLRRGNEIIRFRDAGLLDHRVAKQAIEALVQNNIFGGN